MKKKGDPGRTARKLLLNAWYPDLADWEPITTLLSEKLVAPGDKTNALGALSRQADRLPQTVKDTLAPLLPDLMADKADRPTPFLFDNSDTTGAAIDLASRLGVLDSAEIVSRVTELLKKNPDLRSWAARICGYNSQPELVGILTALTQDPHPSVRATAASWLAYAYVNRRSEPATVTALQACASDPGRQVPAALAAELSRADHLDDPMDGILSAFRSHPSALVRKAAAQPQPV